MPPEVANGKHNGQDKAVFTMGMSVRYTCNPGYFLVGNAAVSCRASGNWSQPRPRCEGTVCINPVVANGRRVVGHGLLSAPGQTLTFRCHDGYSLQGSASVSCQEDGSWQPPAPVCDRALPHHSSFTTPGKQCGHPGEPVNGKIISLTNLQFGSTVVYRCEEG
ncbi:hypothetical protein DV515_00012259 [Chloebia gouldiae]|uniref:Sushi domain-containing protein n=1 Tax=Chloebia gouldiae TaxID=44316 RepID=A0A3L8S592_CHLGU|nr:hypothetical protein DV515_00012259 [Chloebia gouldiae]